MGDILPHEKGPAKAAPPQLVVDAMLGSLARWLRLAGYDAAYWREGSDDALMAHAAAEGRMIVTRDRGLAGRRGVWALLVAAEELDAQVAEVRVALGPPPEPFTRCPECNGALEELSRDAAQERVPPYVWHTQTAFRSCRGCGRVYWKGTHWPAVEARLQGDAP